MKSLHTKLSGPSADFIVKVTPEKLDRLDMSIITNEDHQVIQAWLTRDEVIWLRNTLNRVLEEEHNGN